MDDIGLEVRLLGPVEVRLHGATVGPAGAKRRGLFALLALDANRVVPVYELVDGLWGEGPPASSSRLVATYAWAWRKALGAEAAARLVTVGSGYRLDLAARECDLATFTELAAQARAAVGSAAEAAALLRRALDLWRGPALADLVGEPFHRVAADRLEDLRLHVVEAWAEATLTTGAGTEVAWVLGAELADAPLRERLAELAMWALSQQGRQAEALALYERTRTTLADELGVDPGEALRRMHARVLRQDPALLSVAPQLGAATASSLDARAADRSPQVTQHGSPGCRACGTAISTGMTVCPSCSRPVPLVGADPAEERKVVTVLRCELWAAESLDPEDLIVALAPFRHRLRAEPERFGGTVERLPGDSVMAVFGAPAAHEDDAERAVRAGLAIVAAVGELNAVGTDPEIELRVGIATGEAVVSAAGRPEQGNPLVTGDVLARAARLAVAASAGTVVVDPATYRRTAGRLAFSLLDPASQGSQAAPLEAWRALGVSGAPGSEVGASMATRPGLRAPMVGRDQEMALLRSIYSRLAGDARAQLVTIYGDPGVGKSRLANEFTAALSRRSPAAAVLRGRCLPYGEGVTYWPLAEILKAETGVLDTDQPEAALAKIGRLAETALRASSDPERVAAALAFTFGLEDPRFGFGAMAPRQVRLETHAAWCAFFSGRGAAGPLVAVIEDIHWADAVLLDLLEELADRTVGAVLFLCPARPELLGRRPTWGGGRRNFSSISLEPLSPDDARRLVGLLLAVGDLPERLTSAMLARAEGNPFFLEEIIHQLIDEGRLVRTEDRRRAAEDIGELVIPDTVHGVLAARIDLLAPEEKRALRSAAVVGRIFWSGSVANLLNGDAGDLDDVLARLEGRELVRSRIGSSMAGERELIFKHVLTRDVAYGTLPRRERVAAHARTAEWIEDRAGARRREFAELLAYHYAEAYEGSLGDRSDGPDGPDSLRCKTFDALLLASDEARSRMLLEKARLHGERALAIAVGPAERSLALEALGMAALWDFRGDAAWAQLTAAVDERLASGSDDHEAIALLCAWAVEPPMSWPGSMSRRLGEEAVRRYLDIGLAHAAETGEARIRLLAVKAAWPYAFCAEGFTDDEAVPAREAGEQAVAMALRADRPDLASTALGALASIDFIRGYHGRNWPIIERRLEIVAHLSDPWEIGDAMQFAAEAAVSIGWYRNAWRLAREGVERSSAGPPGVWALSLAWAAIAEFCLGDWEATLRDVATLEQAMAHQSWPSFQHTAVRSVAAWLHELRGERAAAEQWMALNQQELPSMRTARKAPWLARLAAHRGEFDAAWQWLDTPYPWSRSIAMAQLLEARCDVAAEQGAWDVAEETLDRALQWARKAQLLALPLHADRLEGRAALARGDVARAVAALTRAREGFASLGARWDEALAALWLAEAMAVEHAPASRAAAASALAVFEELRSVRERDRAAALLGR